MLKKLLPIFLLVKNILIMALCTLSLGTSLTHAAVIEFTFDLSNHYNDTIWTLQADNNGDGVYHSGDWALSMSGYSPLYSGYNDENDSVEVTGDVLFSSDGIWLSGDISVLIQRSLYEEETGWTNDYSEIVTWGFYTDAAMWLHFSPDSAYFGWQDYQRYDRVDVPMANPTFDRDGNTESYVATFSGFEYDVDPPSPPVVAEVAEPGTLAVMGLGMIGLLGFRRRKMLKLAAYR
jgi:hypothetical protein